MGQIVSMALVGLGIEFVKPLCPDTEINKSWSKLYIIAKKIMPQPNGIRHSTI